MDKVYYFAVKTISLSTCGDRKPCTLEVAAAHNLREIQAEHGAVAGSIDAHRMHLNKRMEGPATAAEVQALAASMLDTSKLKRDHVQAIEAVFSLPPGAGVDPTTYFEKSLAWLHLAQPMPLLLATAHHDESAPHLHVLMLPIQDGRHIGNKLVKRDSLKRLREQFYTQVASPLGLVRHGAKLRGQLKQSAIQAVLRECEAKGLPDGCGLLWPEMRSLIEKDPTPFFARFGIDMEAVRACAIGAAQSPIALASPIALHASPIALGKVGPKNEGLSCVALAQSTHPTEPPKAVRMVSERASATPEQLGVDSAAHRQASGRQTPAPMRDAAPATVVCEDGLTRERDGWVDPHDESVPDLSAWDGL